MGNVCNSCNMCRAPQKADLLSPLLGSRNGYPPPEKVHPTNTKVLKMLGDFTSHKNGTIKPFSSNDSKLKNQKLCNVPLNEHFGKAPPEPPAFGEERILMVCCIQHNGDMDKLFRAIKNVEKKCNSETDFLKTIAKYPRAMNYLASYRLTAELNMESVPIMYQYAGDYLRAGKFAIQAAYAQSNCQQRLNGLKEACKLLHLGGSKAHLYATAVYDQIALLEMQLQLETITGEKCFVDLSLYESIQTLLALSIATPIYMELVLQLCKKFNVSSTQLWWIKLYTYRFTKNWEQLYAESLQEYPSIGYLPIIKTLLDGERMDLATKISNQIKDPQDHEKSKKMFLQCTKLSHPSESDSEE